MNTIILGATRGMGRALARQMAARGDTLFLLEDEAPPEYVEGFKEAIRQIDRNAKANGWPPVVYYPVDEPCYQGERAIKAAGLQYRWVKEAVPGAKTLCPSKARTDAQKKWSAEYLLPYVDIQVDWIRSDEERRVADEQITSGLYEEYWGCTGPGNTETNAYTRARIGSGFKFKKSGMTGMIYWTYGTMGQGTSEGWHYGTSNGQWNEHIDIPDKIVAISYRSPTDRFSPVPTLAWEGVREGLDDLKYILTLERMIARAKAGGRRAKIAARAAESRLKSILDQVPWGVQSIDWWEAVSGETVRNPQMNKYRWQVSQSIMELAALVSKPSGRNSP